LANRVFEKKFPNAAGKYCPRLVHGSEGPVPECPLEDSIEKGFVTIEKEVYDRENNKWYISTIYPLRFKVNGKRVFVHFTLDITERKKAEEGLKKTNKLLRIINRINELMIRERDIDKLVNDVINELSAEYVAGWIVVKLGGEQKVFTSAITEKIDIHLFECVKRALSDGETVVLSPESHFKHCMYFELHSSRYVMAVPMKVGERIVGVVVIHSNKEFSDEEKELIQTFANDLAFAVNAIELEEIKRRAYKQIEENIVQYATLVDHIRNPLAAISLIAEVEVNRETGEKILAQVERIKEVLRKLDEGWIESENIREFLKKFG
jgi:two-component system response regulator